MLQPEKRGYCGESDRSLLYEIIRSRRKKRRVELTEALEGTGLIEFWSGIEKREGSTEVLDKKDELRENAQPKSSSKIIVRNDYLQSHINIGARPQNHIREAAIPTRFAEYPKLAQLAALKNAAVKAYATPPMYLKADLRKEDLSLLLSGSKFDVILIDPPLWEYCEWSPPTLLTCPDRVRPYWSWEEIAALRIEDIAATPSFIFVWVGDCEGLEKGRELLSKWGYRRCEDISWVKTNKKWEGTLLVSPPSVLQHTKEHCLMGIRGTVRRSTDGHFIHCNVDTDVIIAEEPSDLTTQKPQELYYLIEHFCMGRRRLELFGNDWNIRPGWVTVGLGLSTSNWDKDRYAGWFAPEKDAGASGSVRGGTLVPTTPGNYDIVYAQLSQAPISPGGSPEIQILRPKSPPRYAQK